MKKYDVYVIGNALVDIEFEVSYESLIDLKIEKGVMTLIDAEREQVLLEELDGIKHRKSCGGSAANTSMAAQQFGSQVFYSCKVAADDNGDFFLEDMISQGVDTNLTATNREPGVTGKCVVMITPDADRTMNTYLGITETLSVESINEEALAQAKYLYIEGYPITSATGRPAQHQCKQLADKQGVKTAFTLSDPAIVNYFRQPLKEVIGEGVDLLFCNEAEAMLFCETENFDKATECLKRYAKTFAITRGPHGAVVFDGEQFIEIAPRTVKVVDTVGAGDVFAGSFLHAITNGLSFEQAGNFANLAASEVVTTFGPRLSSSQVEYVKSQLGAL